MPCPALILLVLLVLWLPLPVASASLTLDIVLSARSAPYLEAARALRHNLAPELFAEQGVKTWLLEDWLARRQPPAGVVVTLGTRAAHRLVSLAGEYKLLSSMITASTYHLMAGSTPIRRHWAAIVLDQPAYRYVRLIAELLPEARRLGLLYGDDSRRLLGSLDAVGKEHRLTLQMIHVQPDDNVAKAIKRLVRDSDVILALPDPLALSPQNAKWLLYMAYQRGIPVIGYSHALAKAGALAALYTTPQQIGRETAEFLNRYGEDGSFPAGMHTARYFKLALNPWVARSLHINVPEEKELSRRLHRQEGRHGAE